MVGLIFCEPPAPRSLSQAGEDEESGSGMMGMMPGMMMMQNMMQGRCAREVEPGSRLPGRCEPRKTIEFGGRINSGRSSF